MGNDWSTFADKPEVSCYCKCGTHWLSHAKTDDSDFTVSRKPCPCCKRCDNIYKVGTAPEIIWDGKRAVPNKPPAADAFQG